MPTKTKKPQVVRLADVLRDEESQKLLGQTISGLIENRIEDVLSPFGPEPSLSDPARLMLRDRIRERINDWETKAKTEAPLPDTNSPIAERRVPHWGLMIAILGLLGGVLATQHKIGELQREIAAIEKTSGTGTVTSDVPVAYPTYPTVATVTIATPPVLYVTAGDKPCWLRITNLGDNQALDNDGSILYEGMITGRAPFNLIAGETYEVRDGCPGSLSFDAEGSFELTADELKNLSGKPHKSEVLHIKP
jgi:hypothetical protein